MATDEETVKKPKVNTVVTENNMANDSNFAASPYPVYNFGHGDDDSVQQSLLTSHSTASVERNQDSQFAAARQQFTHRDVVGVGKDTQVLSLQNKFDISMHLKDSDRRQEARLARIEAKLDAQQIAGLTAQLAESKADARNSSLQSILEAILKKLP